MDIRNIEVCEAVYSGCFAENKRKYNTINTNKELKLIKVQ